MMVLTVAKLDGTMLSVALDAARGDGITIQVAPPDGLSEPLSLLQLTGLSLTTGEMPVLVAEYGRFQAVHAVWPESRVHVGWEDPSAPALTNKKRSASFLVRELAAVRLDADLLTVPVPQPEGVT